MYKIFAIFAVLAIVNCEVEIPQEFRNAKDISQHPRYQSLLQRVNPKALNDNQGINPLIIGGSNATRGQFPHQILIYLVYSPQEVYLCGGSLIKRDWIITAGHCAYQVQYLQVYTGIASREGPASWGGQIYPSDIYVHPNYDDNNLWNDIALVNLAEAPENLLDDIYTDVIDLPVLHISTDFNGMTGTVSGFGRTSDTSAAVSDILKYNQLKAITNEECASVFIPGLVQDTNICAETSSQASTCGGDSGGPYSFNLNGKVTLIGITSFGASLGCELGYPVGFTRVTKYLEWIYDVTFGFQPTTVSPSTTAPPVTTVSSPTTASPPPTSSPPTTASPPPTSSLPTTASPPATVSTTTDTTASFETTIFPTTFPPEQEEFFWYKILKKILEFLFGRN